MLALEVSTNSITRRLSAASRSLENQHKNKVAKISNLLIVAANFFYWTASPVIFWPMLEKNAFPRNKRPCDVHLGLSIIFNVVAIIFSVPAVAHEFIGKYLITQNMKSFQRGNNEAKTDTDDTVDDTDDDTVAKSLSRPRTKPYPRRSKP